MHRLFRREQILTMPNLLSLFRLLLIPVIIWLYCEKEDYIAAAIMTVLSGLTDIADGVIARKFHLVSDFGKILDPIADKLTQAALIFCLISKFEWMIYLFIFFAVKEVTMGISGLIVIKKKDVVNSAQWFGKLSTMVLYAVMILLFLFPDISTGWAKAMILLCAAVLLLSLVKYLIFHCRLLRGKDVTD